MAPINEPPVVDIGQDHSETNRQLADGFAQYMACRNYSPGYRYLAKIIIKKYIEFLRTEDVRTIDTPRLRRYLFHIAAEGASPQKVHSYVQLLRRFYRSLMVIGLVQSNPAQYLSYPKLSRKLPAYLTHEQAVALIAAAANPFERAVCELLYATGLRTGEIRRLRIEHIDFKAGSLRVVQGKGRKDRRVFFGPSCSEALCAHVGTRLSGFLFANSRGGALPKPKMSAAVSGPAKRAELGYVTPLALRHSFATSLVNRGMDIRHVGELMGHVRVSTTQIYSHLTTKDLARTINEFHPHGEAL